MALRHFENLTFGKANQIGDILVFVVGAALNLGGRADELALHILLGNDFGMELDIRCRAHLLSELCKIGRTSDLLQLLSSTQTLGNGVEVDRLQLHSQRLYGFEDNTMLLGVE